MKKLFDCLNTILPKKARRNENFQGRYLDMVELLYSHFYFNAIFAKREGAQATPSQTIPADQTDAPVKAEGTFITLFHMCANNEALMIRRATVGSLGIDDSELARLTLEDVRTLGADLGERVRGGIDLLVGLEPTKGSTRNQRNRGGNLVLSESGEIKWLDHVQKGMCFRDELISDTDESNDSSYGGVKSEITYGRHWGR